VSLVWLSSVLMARTLAWQLDNLSGPSGIDLDSSNLWKPFHLRIAAAKSGKAQGLVAYSIACSMPSG
jgi:hypothetical protein